MDWLQCKWHSNKLHYILQSKDKILSQILVSDEGSWHFNVVYLYMISHNNIVIGVMVMSGLN